jgi:hypothetical protein
MLKRGEKEKDFGGKFATLKSASVGRNNVLYSGKLNVFKT